MNEEVNYVAQLDQAGLSVGPAHLGVCASTEKAEEGGVIRRKSIGPRFLRTKKADLSIAGPSGSGVEK
ncbi:hypothetical protein A2U01_0072701, partial [Trifolium medium]|nr:hypothetical protein [Trifolium medium]